MRIEVINKIYEFARQKLSYEEVSTLSTMLYSIVKKHEERQRVIDLNNELDVFNKKCSWKENFTPVELLKVPEV